MDSRLEMAIHRLDKLRSVFANYYNKSRLNKLKLFFDLARPVDGAMLLDIGFNPFEGNSYENLLERNYAEKYRIVAITLDDARSVKSKYPCVRFVQADGRNLPFADKSIDTVFSNAVIEHVGKTEDQRRFVEEVVRVCRKGFLSTPNFWFPIELHSNLPFVHFLPWRIRRYIFRYLANEQHEEYMSNVHLLSSGSFRRLFPSHIRVRIFRLRVTFWPEQIAAYFDNHA